MVVSIEIVRRKKHSTHAWHPIADVVQSVDDAEAKIRARSTLDATEFDYAIRVVSIDEYNER